MAKPDKAIEAAAARLADSETDWAGAQFDLCPARAARLMFDADRELFTFSFTGSRDAQLSVLTSGPALTDTVVLIYGPLSEASVPPGPLLQADDDGGEGGLSSIRSVALPEDGEYLVALTSWHGRAVGQVVVSILLDGRPPCVVQPEPACLSECNDEGRAFYQSCRSSTGEASACQSGAASFADRCIQSRCGVEPEECEQACVSRGWAEFGRCLDEGGAEASCEAQADRLTSTCAAGACPSRRVDQE